MSYTGDDRDQQQEHSITGSAPYVATTYSSNAVPGNPWNDARNNRFDSEYTDQISYTTNQAPYTTNSGILQTFQQLSLQQNELYGSDTSDDDFQGYSSLATRHLPMDSDHGTVFGRICKEMGLLKEDYWKDPSRYQKPASYWNGERLQNNCVFVSIGYLLGMPSEELSTYLQAKPLCAQLQGIDLGDIERILYRIPGLNIVTFPIHPESSHNWGSQHLESQQRFALSKLTKYLKGSDREFAVGYQRGIKNGHCVVAQKLRRRDGTRMEDYQFTCFQHETDGRDMSEDVRKSFISFAIFVDRGSNHRALNCFYECTPQRNGSGTAASTDHVMLYDDGSNSTTSNYQHPTDYNCPSTSYSASNSISVASASEYPRTTSSKTTKHRKNRK
ncbi:hypothetical protein BGZ60DRAFT_420391 [Tricladium varicosporioides]|nr:hypothetical protein BGZ60DRAFT_420391 [Hymenoscyphus varicosporioides]